MITRTGRRGCRAVRRRVEALTDTLVAKPYESLEPDELDELMTSLEPLARLLLAAQDQWAQLQWRGPRAGERSLTLAGVRGFMGLSPIAGRCL